MITQENYSEIFSSSDHLTEILKELNKGNYIQLWGDYCTNPEKEDGVYDKISQSDSSSGKNAKNKCTESYVNERSLVWYYYDDENILQKYK
jgi:hypothetical protein